MKNRLHIAYVSDAIYPYNKGGKEKRIFDISTRLVKLGHRVDIYTMKWWPEVTSQKTEYGISLHAICGHIPLYSNGRRSIKEAVFFGLSCIKLWNKEFDVVEVDHMPYFPVLVIGIICAVRKKKMIVTWLEIWDQNYWNQYLGKIGVMGMWIQKIIVFLPYPILSISQHTTQKLKTVLGRTKNITTITPGIDIKKINSAKPTHPKSDVIFVGRLLKHKNVEMLIESIAITKKQFPNIHCLIIGEGPEKSALQQKSAILGLEKNISFLNFITDDTKLYGVIKSSKVLVNPSVREGFGIIVIEANACGIPTVVIDHKDNASKDLVTAGLNGFISKPDAKELSSKTILALNTKNMADKCKREARKYDIDMLIPDYENAYGK